MTKAARILLVDDYDRHRLLRGCDEIRLTPKEFELLALLARNPDRVRLPVSDARLFISRNTSSALLRAAARSFWSNGRWSTRRAAVCVDDGPDDQKKCAEMLAARVSGGKQDTGTYARR